MIKVKVKPDSIKILGHAGYAEAGKDIVCSSASSIITTTINAILTLKTGTIDYQSSEGLVDIKILNNDETTRKLLDNMLTMLEELSREYKKNIKVEREWNIVKNLMKLNIQLFAHVKAQGSTQNGRDSAGRRLGAKASDGETVNAGSILYRQRGTKIYPGTNVGMGKDHTLFAKITGVVKYERLGKDKKKVSVYEK